MSVLWNIIPRSCSMYVTGSVLLRPTSKSSCRGGSAISPGEKHIVVSNLFDGLDFYSIADRTLNYSVPCPINQQNNVPVPVLFNSDGSVIIVGGTSGSVVGAAGTIPGVVPPLARPADPVDGSGDRQDEAPEGSDQGAG